MRFLFPATYVKHQQDILRVCSVLPGGYSVARVKAAISASGVDAHQIYESLCAGEETVAVALFYEALHASTPNIQRWRVLVLLACVILGESITATVAFFLTHDARFLFFLPCALVWLLPYFSPKKR